MLLRRFIQNVKEQNWFVVGLDLTVVILGIFLGLQVTEFSDSRKDAEKERVIVGRLLEEASVGLEQLDEYLNIQINNYNGAQNMLSVVTDKSGCELSEEEAIKGVVAVSSFQPLKFDFTVIEELVKSGKLELIVEDDFRQRVNHVRNDLAYLNKQWNRYVTIRTHVLLDALPAIGAYPVASSSISMDARTLEVSGIRASSPENLCHNTQLIGSMTINQATLGIFITYIRQFISELNAYHNEILKYQRLLS